MTIKARKKKTRWKDRTFNLRIRSPRLYPLSYRRSDSYYSEHGSADKIYLQEKFGELARVLRSCPNLGHESASIGYNI